jgi:integrase
MPSISITEAWLRRVSPGTPEHDALFADGATRFRYWDSSLPGFGVVLGRSSATFIARARVSGRQRDVTIGRHGRPGAGEDNSDRWTEARARREAMRVLGTMANGEDPAKAVAPTLRDAYDAHVARLTKLVKGGKRSQATIDTLLKSQRYVEDWLDRPIVDLRGADLAVLHTKIKAQASPRGGSKNEKGASLANRVITNLSTVWNTLNKKLEGALGNWNPAKSVDKDALQPKRVRISTEDLPRWYAQVQTMRNAIQQDGLVFALFTGLRSEDVRSARFEKVDLAQKTLRLPDPKGGPDAAFTIPLPDVCVEIVQRRRKENERVLGKPDGGWIFPGLDRNGEPGPISDLRQQVHRAIAKPSDADADRVEHVHERFPREDVHTLRRTWESVGHEAGVSDLDLRVLSNHTFASRDVHEIYIAQHLAHLMSCVRRIERALWQRIRDEVKKPPVRRTRSRSPRAASTRQSSSWSSASQATTSDHA